MPIFVFECHDFLAEIALSQVEIQAVHRNQLCKQNIISLPLRVVQIVAEHESGFLGGMRVKVDKHKQVLKFGVLNDQMTRSIGGRPTNSI